MLDKTPKHIVFLHIPKAGGTTLRNILQRQYSSSDVFEIGEDINGDINRFRYTPRSKLRNIKLLIGHMTHGLHQVFPNKTVCLTMLRDPVDRVYSEYRFLSSNKHHPLYAVVSPLTFHQYLEVDPTRQAGNGQTRLLSGSTYGNQTGIPGVEPLNQAHLDNAMENLKKYYSMVGLLKKFDESLLMWRNAFGWRYPLYEKMNITKRRSRSLSHSEIEHALEKNQLDVALYDQAEILFNANYCKQYGKIQKQINLFKKLNKAYQSITGHGRIMIKKLVKNK